MEILQKQKERAVQERTSEVAWIENVELGYITDIYIYIYICISTRSVMKDSTVE